MRFELTEALNTANRLITSQLDLQDCTSHGEPIIKEARCQQCLQLSACSWRFHALVEHPVRASASLAELRRDFSLAQLLLQQAVDQHKLLPNDHDEAKAWLQRTAALNTGKLEEDH